MTAGSRLGRACPVLSLADARWRQIRNEIGEAHPHEPACSSQEDRHGARWLRRRVVRAQAIERKHDLVAAGDALGRHRHVDGAGLDGFKKPGRAFGRSRMSRALCAHAPLGAQEHLFKRGQRHPAPRADTLVQSRVDVLRTPRRRTPHRSPTVRAPCCWRPARPPRIRCR